MDYYSKYLKYKTKYLELKKQIGGYNATPQQIVDMWKSGGYLVTWSDNQDGWFLNYSNFKDSNTHIHLYTDGSYTYKINGYHQPSQNVGDRCNYYTINHYQAKDAYGCRLFEPNIAHLEEGEIFEGNALQWSQFLLASLNARRGA